MSFSSSSSSGRSNWGALSPEPLVGEPSDHLYGHKFPLESLSSGHLTGSQERLSELLLSLQYVVQI